MWLDLLIPGLAAVIVLAIVGGLISTVVGSGEDQGLGSQAGAIGECDNANLNPATGTAAGLACDDRQAAEIEAIAQGNTRIAAKQADCRLLADLRSEGTEHVPAGLRVAYTTEPPTSGPMYDQTIADGAYLSTPPEPYVVHSLEHGRVAIQYDPRLPETTELTLKAVADEAPTQVLLFPNRRMDSAVAATAWTTLLACPAYTERVVDALRSFRDLYRNQGPETAAGLPR